MARVDHVDFAREFALRAHGTQLYDGRPYVYHLDDVVEIVAEAPLLPGPTTTYVARTCRLVVGYLHDVLEDTPVTAETLEAIFGIRVSECIQVITDPKGCNRKERKRIVNNWLRQIEMDSDLVDALVVKAADRLANVRYAAIHRCDSLFDMYRKEHAAFRRAVFRKKLCDAIWHELDDLLECEL